jgi:hypothetical protein
MARGSRVTAYEKRLRYIVALDVVGFLQARWNATKRRKSSPRSLLLRNPTNGMAACCARAVSGQRIDDNAEPPSTLTNSRRFIDRLVGKVSLAAHLMSSNRSSRSAGKSRRTATERRERSSARRSTHRNCVIARERAGPSTSPIARAVVFLRAVVRELLRLLLRPLPSLLHLQTSAF